MDDQSKAMLDAILAQEPAALTESDIAFLKARSSYLNEEQKAVFAEVLTEQLEAQESISEESESVSPRTRRGRRDSKVSESAGE
jgi:hypothetical protein